MNAGDLVAMLADCVKEVAGDLVMIVERVELRVLRGVVVLILNGAISRWRGAAAASAVKTPANKKTSLFIRSIYVSIFL